MQNQLFTEAKLGPVLLRNRSIRSAAFEGMCPGNKISDELVKYHTAVAAGGIGMTTVAYASVTGSGLSFPHQLLITREAIPAMQQLTDSVHNEGAAAAIQIGHCGQMANTSVSGRCLAPSGGFNLYGPTWPETISPAEINAIVNDFGGAAKCVRDAGFDAIEVHAGHGYLISQFLSTHTNRRKDNYGGSFENRSRFMVEVMRQVMDAVGPAMAVVVKMNLRDGFRGGMEVDEALQVARLLEKEGVHGLVLSGGFVSKAPMYVMRGSMPVNIMAHYMKNPWMKFGTRYFGSYLMKPEPFSEAYFLEDALKVREVVNLPLVFVGGLKSLDVIEGILGKGFDFVQMARALIHDPDFINKLRTGEVVRSACNSTNYCIARMYSGQMACYQHEEDLPRKWRTALEEKLKNGG
jgi:2,4-dienoyl-CoA reductase-like NADH-dependent reductase (Old Yellow Enzyme family)